MPRLGARRAVGFNMTPLIDVVFLLIIFFLVSSHLAQQETQLAMTLPSAASDNDTQHLPGARVTLNVQADGQLLLGSERVSVETLSQRLTVERGETSADLEVRIRADRSLAFQHIRPLLVTCVQAEIWNVTFAVLHKTP
jgi:biopolymer transport protein ExbD